MASFWQLIFPFLPKANKYLCYKQHGVKMFINNKRGICLKQRIFYGKETVVTRLKFDCDRLMTDAAWEESLRVHGFLFYRLLSSLQMQ